MATSCQSQPGGAGPHSPGVVCCQGGRRLSPSHLMSLLLPQCLSHPLGQQPTGQGTIHLTVTTGMIEPQALPTFDKQRTNLMCQTASSAAQGPPQACMVRVAHAGQSWLDKATARVMGAVQLCTTSTSITSVTPWAKEGTKADFTMCQLMVSVTATSVLECAKTLLLRLRSTPHCSYCCFCYMHSRVPLAVQLCCKL